MAHNDNPWDHLRAVQTGDGSHTLMSNRFGQTYHSHHGAVSESLHVFLGNSGLVEALSNDKASAHRVLEIGYGTGLNVLLACSAAVRNGAALEYDSVEFDRLSSGTLRSLRFDELDHVDQRVYAAWDAMEHTRGTTMCVDRCSVRIVEGDAVDILRTPQLPAGVTYRYIFHDAFSPDANPALWTPEFLRALRARIDLDGRLVTYTVKGAVRRALASAGFAVERVPGPPEGKRQVLIATPEG